MTALLQRIREYQEASESLRQVQVCNHGPTRLKALVEALRDERISLARLHREAERALMSDPQLQDPREMRWVQDRLTGIEIRRIIGME